MSEEKSSWQLRFERERKARKESELLLENKSQELWDINQNLENQVNERTDSLKKALEKVQKADNAKSTFLANVSHEIRTPLNAIIGFSERLANNEDLFNENKKQAEIINTSANSLLSIINDILDISKIESGTFEINLEKTNIHLICEHVIELFSKNASQKNIDLVFNIDSEISTWILTDEVRIRQVLSNILSNAIKFTPNDGKVELNIKNIKQTKTKSFIKIEIIDSGIGIAKEKLDKIFKPFIQIDNKLNRQYQGTGLGLSISSYILKALHSKINVKSTVNQGTMFWFDLESDIYLSDSLEKELAPKVIVSEKKKNKIQKNSDEIQMLVAEDNSANQELISYILEKMNIQFKIVSNGKEAVDLYKAEKFDLVLMDINMPILDGVAALNQIREYEKENAYKNTPIIALTANAIKGDKEKFISLGMDDYLSKPINTNALLEILKNYFSINDENIRNKKINIKNIQYRLGISENIANLILAKFKKEIGKDLEELEVLIKKDDEEQIIQKAHYLKNSCLNMALDDICNLLNNLESKNNSFEEKQNIFNKINNDIRELI